jgi:hypothetical protein
MANPADPPPGSPEARTRGCVCSPNQNRNGTGVHRPGFGVVFAALYWCPVHGILGKAREVEQPRLRLVKPSAE